MKNDMQTLLYCTPNSEVPPDLLANWRRRGISLQTKQQLAENEAFIHGLFIDKRMELAEVRKWIATTEALAKVEPMSILLEGKEILYGLADQLQRKLTADQFEVLRLFIFPDGQRAVLGGNGVSKQVNLLTRRLIDEEIITLVCKRIEVDEVVAALPLYLDWKSRFFTYLGGKCDGSGARLEVVSLALGMDKRVGQGWFPAESVDEIVEPEDKIRWLQREVSQLLENTNIDTIAVWTGSDSLCGVAPLFAPFSTVQLYPVSSFQKPNDIPSPWKFYTKPQSALELADLLVILDKDDKIKEISFEVFGQKMRQPRILDACSCYPLQEMETYGLAYRTFGQKTNVWNETAYNRV
ncbi:hypothetical protein [Brevibacillus sp. SYSU BS000544]|uniref:hypothetical protein n=1 Tax=Brevibacillus sp. SYSU BS000544 TaxID=3416443 RepID=UPI003CE494F2